MLAIGIPEEAASAELAWAILGANRIEVAQFHAQGIQSAPGVWCFDLPEERRLGAGNAKRICGRIPGPRMILLIYCGFLTGMAFLRRNTPEGDTQIPCGGE